MNKMTGEEFLQSKDIWNHPTLTDRNNKECYDVAELLEEYATGEPKRKPLSDGTLPLTESELAEFGKIISTQLKNIRLKYDKNVECITYEGEGKSGKTGAGLLYNVKAILYLAERFELTEK